MLDWTKQEVEENMKSNQYGGRKGMSTDHHLVSLWESILRLLDRPGYCVSILGIDFSKSFNRIDHNHCINSLATLGASTKVLELHAAFLRGRRMSVRVGSVFSRERAVNGGCVQGSLLGILQHKVSLDCMDDGLEKSMKISRTDWQLGQSAGFPHQGVARSSPSQGKL